MIKPNNRPAGVGNAFPLWWLSNGAISLQESIERFILSPGAKRPENRVTRFPVEKVRRSRIRGSRVAANHQNANHAL